MQVLESSACCHCGYYIIYNELNNIPFMFSCLIVYLSSQIEAYWDNRCKITKMKEVPFTTVMNHIPLHPFAIKSHPTLIPSLPNLLPTVPPFPRFPDTPLLRHLSLRHPSSVTCHLSPVTSSLHHYRPSLFQISSAPIKFRASFSVMWLDDQHSTFLHSCGEQLLYCNSDLMTWFLVISYSCRLSPYFCI